MLKCHYYPSVCMKQASRMNFMEGSTVHVHVAGQFVPYVNLFQSRSICSNLGQLVST